MAQPKPKPEQVKLVPPEAFEREAAILFRIPPAEVAKAEAERPRRRRPVSKDEPLKRDS